MSIYRVKFYFVVSVIVAAFVITSDARATTPSPTPAKIGDEKKTGGEDYKAKEKFDQQFPGDSEQAENETFARQLLGKPFSKISTDTVNVAKLNCLSVENSVSLVVTVNKETYFSCTKITPENKLTYRVSGLPTGATSAVVDHSLKTPILVDSILPCADSREDFENHRITKSKTIKITPPSEEAKSNDSAGLTIAYGSMVDECDTITALSTNPKGSNKTGLKPVKVGDELRVLEDKKNTPKTKSGN